jgi:hypothetical protein
MIKGIQLVTGEHLIGDLEGADDPSLDIVAMTRPAKVMEMTVAEGDDLNYTYGMTKYVPFAKDELYLVRRSSICIIYEPSEAIKAYYINTVGNGVSEEEAIRHFEELEEEGLDWDEDDYDSGTLH